MEKFIRMIATGMKLPTTRIENTLKLLESGATIPFISRYRKEATGGMDEVQIAEINTRYEKLKEIAKRKQTILSTIEEKGEMTKDIRKRIDNCWESTELEDIYLPFKPKRKTRAEMARQKGLEPLAMLLLMQRPTFLSMSLQLFIKKGIKSKEEALQGARDIIAEKVSEDEESRNLVRQTFSHHSIISSKIVKGKEEDEAAAKYRDYFDFQEPLKHCSSHRLLAIRRGEAEGILKVSITPENEEECITELQDSYAKGNNECTVQVKEAVKDSYKRLIKPSIENEFAAMSKEKADDEAIRVFAGNLRQLLLAPPLGQKRVLGIDPGFRTGCKVVCLDAQANLLHNETIYPHPPKSDKTMAARKITKMVEQYNIDAIAIGNGTASRETEDFITSLIYDHKIQVFVVSEDGASIYSASKTAREEFPDYDVTVRGAISIGRRLMDPLAELVKIDAKSIGVGQYQHDVDQSKLKASLDQTVESCVNLVGVNVNTASKHLLTYVSGLGPTLAQNIVDYRTKNGPFSSRRELMKVPRMGEKAFEQCAGFLRIPGAENPLDNSAVHPESYAIVEQMAKDLKCSVSDLIAQKELRSQIRPKKYVTENIGLPTLNDIMNELDKPGLDPRQQIQMFEFDKNVHSINDLTEGMELPGIVTNITNFGCFVDLGIKEKGLVHVSQLTDRFVSDPTTVVSIHQHVRVKVLSIDMERKRIQLTMKGLNNGK